VATNTEQTRALVTFAGRKAAWVSALMRSSQCGAVVAVDADPLAAMASVASTFEVVPRVDEEERYVAALVEVSARHRIDCIIPLNDTDLPLLSRCVEAFSKIGVRVLLSDAARVARCQDKLEAASWLAGLGLDTPTTRRLEDVLLDPRPVRYPVVVKARRGQGSEGFRVCHASSDLEAAATVTPHAVVQDLVAGEEFNLDILRAADGSVPAVVPKRKLSMWQGSTDKAVSVDRPDLIALGVRIAEITQHLGAIDVDVMESGGRLLVLDINPRLGGGFPFTCHYCPRYVDALLSIGRGLVPESVLGAYRKDLVVYRDVSYYEARPRGA